MLSIHCLHLNAHSIVAAELGDEKHLKDDAAKRKKKAATPVVGDLTGEFIGLSLLLPS